MENDIKQKLQGVLNKENIEEVDVIYILSRIRKLLEIHKDKKNFKVLNFYCNWALHSEIDDIDSISKTLEKDDGTAVLSLMHGYRELDKELIMFFEKHALQSQLSRNEAYSLRFHHLLSGIYSDTSLILKTTTKQKITFKKIEGFGKNSGLFSEHREML